MIAVLFFGRMADVIGQRRIEISSAPEGESLVALRDRLLGPAIADGRIAVDAVHMSLNRTVIRADAQLADGDEVAFFSVFSGG
jgi:molybdopterin synthase sulfur carrier subunit